MGDDTFVSLSEFVQVPTSTDVPNASTTVEDPLAFTEDLGSSYLASLPYFNEFPPNTGLDTSPPVGRTTNQARFSFTANRETSATVSDSIDNYGQENDGASKNDSGFSSWTGASDSQQKFSPTLMRLDSEPGALQNSTTSETNNLVAHTHSTNRVSLIPETNFCPPTTNSFSQLPDLSGLSCVNAVNEELHDRMFVHTLDFEHFPNIPVGVHPTDQDCLQRNDGDLPTSTNHLHPSHSGADPTPAVAVRPDHIRQPAELPSPSLWTSICPERTFSQCCPYRRPGSAPVCANSVNWLGDKETDSGHDNVDTGQDGDDEGDVTPSDRTLKRPPRLRRLRHPSHQSTDAPPEQGGYLFTRARELASSPTALCRPQNSLRLRRRHPPELHLPTSASCPIDNLATQPPLAHNGERTFDSPTPVSVYESLTTHTQSLMPDVVPRHLCPLVIPRVVSPVSRGTDGCFFGLHSIFTSSSRLPTPRCSSVPLPGFTNDPYIASPVPSGADNSGGDRVDRRMSATGSRMRAGSSFTPTSLSLLAQRMANIGDEMETSHSARVSAPAGTLWSSVRRATHTAHSVWSLSSNLVSLVTSPLECMNRIFQFASQSTVSSITSASVRATNSHSIQYGRRRTATYTAGTSNSHQRHSASYRLNIEPGNLMSPHMHPVTTSTNMRLPIQASTPRHRLHISTDMAVSSPRSLNLPRPDDSNMDDEVFIFDHE
ncbi:hypothetical protein CRM22_009223 [Opisthorchis felineus]|uniref:Uncharacterized protein n=1 Tax=Opisthorchis felineus TaxID=147828 RepID=A0A4S2LEU7_OPIFE|nr:hypothetical protein CRM22_009223 [Opisthorchis felineus]